MPSPIRPKTQIRYPYMNTTCPRRQRVWLLVLAILALSLPLHGCVGVNHNAAAPIGLHPEDAPSPSGEKLSR